MGPVCLGNISKDWSADNMKRTRFTGSVYDFSVDYEAITVDDIKNIHKYLMEKNDIAWNTSLIIKNVYCTKLIIHIKWEQ